MRLYYTNADKFLAPQTVVDKSLGGFVSNSAVPNDFINNLFGDTSQNFKQSKLKETKALVLKNEFSSTIKGIKVYFSNPDETSKIEIAIVQPNFNDCNEAYLEQIPSMRALPLYAVFQEANGADNAIEIGEMKAGAYIGIWFKKTAIAETNVCDNLYEKQGLEQVEEQPLQFCIEWI